MSDQPTNPSEFNYSSFMGVIAATQQDEKGILIPGHLMPSGRPVRAEGVAKHQLMQGQDAKNMAMQWFESVKGQYEREEEERDREASKPDVPELVIGGGDTTPREPDPSPPAAEEAPQTLEAELQARAARWEALMEREQAIITHAQARYDDAFAEYKRAQRALDAIRQED